MSNVRLRHDRGVPVDVGGRAMGHLMPYLYGVQGDVQEVLQIGACSLEYQYVIPFCDPRVPAFSVPWAETLLIGWRRETLDIEILPAQAVTEVFTAGGGGTIVFLDALYELYARVISDVTPSEVAHLSHLRYELQYKERQEAIGAAAAQAYGVFLNTDLDRDTRPLRYSLMSLDALARSADLLTEASIQIGDRFRWPNNTPANLLKGVNVWDQQIDLGDGVDIVEMDHNRDHATADFAVPGAPHRLWRTTAAPVGAGILSSLQMSRGEAKYPLPARRGTERASL